MLRAMRKSQWELLKWIGMASVVFLFSLLFGMRADADGDEKYTVAVAKNYLALRNEAAYDDSNEIGKLYTGEEVEIVDKTGSVYWTVYSDTVQRVGYVNKNYLTNKRYTATVKVSDGYLALRSEQAYDSSNEIGKLYTGDTVQVANTEDSVYWLVYSPSLNLAGYVNKEYLTDASAPDYSAKKMSVQVSSGYLALRKAKAYDYSNEIGKLYSGDIVYVEDTSNDQYWLVYSPSLSMIGYVDKNYLKDVSSVVTKTVKVSSGYLALRDMPSYDSSNVIAQLYTGDTVQIMDGSDNDYWYVYVPQLGISGYVNQKYLY